MAADIQRQTTPITVKFARPVAGVAVPELGIADLSALEGQYPRHENVTAILAKVDHMLTARHRLSVRASFSRSDGNNIAGGATLLSQAPSNLETFRNQGVSIVASLSSSVGTRLFLETKVQTSRETRPRTPQSDGPQVQISDTGTFGGALFLPSTQDMYRYQVSENVAYVRGQHDVEVRRGLQRLQHAQQLVRPGAERRLYVSHARGVHRAAAARSTRRTSASTATRRTRRRC